MRSKLPTIADRLITRHHPINTATDLKSPVHYVSKPHFSILNAINGTDSLKKAHSNIITSGLHHNLLLANRLMNWYASFGLVSYSQKIFGQMPDKNVFSWTILVSGLVKNGLFPEAMDGFRDMVKSGLLPNEVTIGAILPALASLGFELIGRSVHCFWVRHGSQSNVVLQTSLVDMYSRFGCMRVARKVFDGMTERNLVSWNVMMSGYSDNNLGDEALVLFSLIQRDGIKVDCFTVMGLVSAASHSTSGTQTAPSVHCLTFKTGYVKELRVHAALVNMYICKGLIEDAHDLFNEMAVKDVITWTLMLKGLSAGKYLNKAFDHFSRMMRACRSDLDSISLVSIIACCNEIGSWWQGRTLHGLAVKLGFSKDVFIKSALIDMYANCGDLFNARNLFQWMDEKDMVCWNALISATGRNGYGYEAVDLFNQMRSLGLCQNDSTFVSVLSACSHSGMVEEGLHIFSQMVESGDAVLNLQHFSCIVDLLGRAGHLDNADSLIRKLPTNQHSSGIYGSLLSSCRAYGSIDVGTRAFNKLLELGSVDPGHYSSLSSMLASVANWQGVDVTRNLQRHELNKVPGYSLVEVSR